MTRTITEINVHCSATKLNWMVDKSGADKVAEIKRWHVIDNGWSDIGYHYIIDRDGKFYRGRSEVMTGAFEPKVNARAIGICLIGGHGSSATDSFEKNYTPEQDATLRKMIASLKDKHPTISKVTGHNDYANKACPGFKVSRWLDGKPNRVFAESKTAVGSSAAAVSGAGLASAEVVKVFSETTSEVKASVTEVQAAKADVVADTTDPLKWVLLAVVVIGAVVALYSRWRDWQAGRQ